MCRGIATFGLLARLAPSLAAVTALSAFAALRWPASVCDGPLPPPPVALTAPAQPPPPAASTHHALEMRGGSLHVPNGWRLDLTGATLVDVTFTGDLGAADLSQARLWECDLRQARLKGADLRGTRYDAFTHWPEGFDPRAVGARAED